MKEEKMEGEKRKKLWMVFALLFATLAFLTVGCASAATHYVISGESIQAAVDNANAGDTIFVYNGTYTENVDVNKQLTLKGEGADVVTVRAARSGYEVFEVTVDYVNISGFTVTGSTGSNMAAIKLNGVDHCDISENNAHGNCEGIRLSGSSNNTLKDNTLNSNDHFGFFLQGSSDNNTLANNIANSNDYGIYVSYSSSNTLTNNTVNSNRDSGIYLYDSDSNTLENNIANSNECCGIYLYSYNYKYPSTRYNTLTGNIANSNDCGIRLSASSNNTLVNNTANSNEYGIHISYKSSIYNTIHHNNFADNTQFDAHDTYNSANTWDNGTEGNYNSDYTGIDLDGDGIGDTPYLIPGSDGGVDNYPLMQPWKGYRVHNPETGEDFLGIQAAIDDSDTNDRHTIIVDAGVYKMNVNVNKRLTLQGAGSGVVSVIAGQSDDHVFDVTANYVDISGFTVTGAGSGKGIYLNYTNHCNISDNTVLNNEYGIYLNSSMCISLVNNTISGNVYNFVLRGGSLSEYIHNIDTSNTVDEKPIYYWADQRDKIIPGDAGYVGAVNSTNITVRDLTLTKNGEGVLFVYVEHSVIENVTVNWNKDYGIYLYSSSSNTLANTNVSSNGDYGIYLQNSNSNLLTENIANSNDHGIYLNSSSSNTLTNSNASSNEDYGIYLLDSGNNTLLDNTANSNNQYGITMHFSNDNALQNNSASNNNYGVDLYSSINNTLSGNTVNLNNWNGIKLDESSNNTLASNTADSNGDYGIYMSSSSSNKIIGNTIGSNDCGIYLNSSSSNTLANNNASSNVDYGIYLYHSKDNKLTENTANWNSGDIGYYGNGPCDWKHWFGHRGGDGYGYGIYLKSSSYNTLTGNTANYNGGCGGAGGSCRGGGDGGNGYGYGIYLYSSSNNTLAKNTVNSNGGRGGAGGSGGDIYGGDGGNGYGYGIYLSSSSNNTLMENTANSNGGIGGRGGQCYDIDCDNGDPGHDYGYGIKLPYSNNNLIYNNYFNNTNNVYDDGVNAWNITKEEGTNIIGGPYLGGNYWYDYAGEDTDGDGLGDTLLPYNSSGNIVSGGDYLPLVHVSTVQFDTKLKSGWNLISVPLNLTMWELGNESVVGDPLNVTPKNSLTSIYRYNTTSGLFEKCDHFDDWGWWQATGSESFTKLEPGRGYWVMTKNGCFLTFTGTEPSDLNIGLDAGWNLIGWYSVEEVLLGEEAMVGNPLNVTPKNSLTSIYRYNSSTGLFEKCDHFDDWGWWQATGSENFTKLEPGRGYWVMAKNDCEWRHET